jgi:hypothetical protein
VNLLSQTPGHDLILQNALQKKKQNSQMQTAGNHSIKFPSKAGNQAKFVFSPIASSSE